MLAWGVLGLCAVAALPRAAIYSMSVGQLLLLVFMAGPIQWLVTVSLLVLELWRRGDD